MHRFEIAVAYGTAAVVELVKVAVEVKERAEDLRIEVLHDGIGLVDPVLQRRAGEHEGERRPQRFHLPRRLGLPILDALSLIQDHHVGLEQAIDLVGVAHHLLVVDQREESRLGIEPQPLGTQARDEAHVAVGEAGDLLLPFRLDRCGRDHEHARDAFLPREQFAGGDRLHGLAEAHLIGKQRALVKREMRRAVFLIREQRQLDDIPRRTALLHGGEKLCAQLFARGKPQLTLEPGIELARDAHRIGRGRRRIDERLDVGRVCFQHAVPAAERGEEGARFRIRPGLGREHCRGCGARTAEKNLDPRRQCTRACFEAAGAALARKRRQDSLDVLAGAEPIDAVIDAAAGIVAAREIADLHFVRRPGARAHAERPECSVFRLERLDAGDFGAAAPAPQVQLVLVRGFPAVQRRFVQHLAGATVGLALFHEQAMGWVANRFGTG